jgi:hypothetical protein
MHRQRPRNNECAVPRASLNPSLARPEHAAYPPRPLLEVATVAGALGHQAHALPRKPCAFQARRRPLSPSPGHTGASYPMEKSPSGTQPASTVSRFLNVAADSVGAPLYGSEQCRQVLPAGSRAPAARGAPPGAEQHLDEPRTTKARSMEACGSVRTPHSPDYACPADTRTSHSP